MVGAKVEHRLCIDAHTMHVRAMKTVRLTDAAYTAIADYAEQNNQSINSAVSAVVLDWMATIGEAHSEPVVIPAYESSFSKRLDEICEQGLERIAAHFAAMEQNHETFLQLKSSLDVPVGNA